ncbi:MAG: Cof-type HAD-IIB family hydrolase [Parachlamydia sp.]|nr:Cof-type HAD-IIB family hydrolase [Parachlamydia sp.]
MQGIIALDIDGTITAEHNSTPAEVVDYLGQLSQEWHLIFITGRTFQWGYSALRTISYPYHFAVNNGALMLEMPKRKIVSRKYLSRDFIPGLEEICQKEGTDFVLYGGYECGDQCYYRPKRLDISDYFKRRCLALEEPGIAVDSFDEVPLKEFAAAKCFAEGATAARLSSQIEQMLSLHAPAIRDPYDNHIYVVQATHPEVSKGETVDDFKKLTGSNGIVIAAGDDNNDRPMLAHADIKVVMATAPEDMRAAADIIAPAARELGIIKGLKEAVERHARHRRF